MPNIIELLGYKIFFWANENDEPIHVHITKGRPVANSTKIWLTKSGGCVLANNNSQIPKKDLSKLMDSITSNYFFIVAKWKEFNIDKELRFFC